MRKPREFPVSFGHYSLVHRPEFVALVSDEAMGSLLARISATAEMDKGWPQMTSG